jgi:hypothetical protein
MFLASLSSTTTYAIVDALGHAPTYTGVLYVAQGAGSVAVGLSPDLLYDGSASGGSGRPGSPSRRSRWRRGRCRPTRSWRSAAIGLGLPCVLIAAFTAVQRELPGPLLGRATATANTLIFTPNVIGLGAGAALVELVDHRLLLVLYGLALLRRRPRSAAPSGHAPPQSPPNASRTSARSPSDANPA